MTATITSYDPFLRDWFSKKKVAELTSEDHPFLDKLTKTTGSGKRWLLPFIDSDPEGLGATLTAAQAGAAQTSGGNLGGEDWVIPWGDYSGSVYLSDKVMAASASDIGAFFDHKTKEIEGLYRAFGNAMARYALSDSGRSLCHGVFTSSSGLVTLSAGYEGEIANVRVGMIVYPSANDGTSTSHTLVSSAGAGYVVAVNPNAGTFTVSATSGGSGGAPANWVNSSTYYFFRSSDFGGDTTPNAIFLGYGAWCPAADPADTFYGVARGTNPLARGGLRLTTTECAGIGIEARIKKLFAKGRGRASLKAKDVYMHPEQWQRLADSIEATGRRNYTETSQAGVFGFETIKVMTPSGGVRVWADKQMPMDAFYAPDFDAIRIATLDGFPKVVNGDGLTMLRSATANTYEYRIQAYPAFGNESPGTSGRGPLEV